MNEKEKYHEEYVGVEDTQPIIDIVLTLKRQLRFARDSAEFTAIKDIVDILIDKEGKQNEQF